MGVGPEDSEILSEIRAIIGLRAWGVRVGVGSFVTANFGNSIRDSRGSERGEYFLWLYGADWVLSGDGIEIVNSEQRREEMERGVATLEGVAVVAARVDQTSLALFLLFEDGLCLSVTPLDDPDEEHWMLYLPDGAVITAGPGRTLHRVAGDSG